MPRGGPRPGSGRPKGSFTRLTRETAEAVSVMGATPLAYLHGVMTDPNASDDRRDMAALALMPYMHPRIAPLPPSLPDLPSPEPRTLTIRLVEPDGPRLIEGEVA